MWMGDVWRKKNTKLSIINVYDREDEKICYITKFVMNWQRKRSVGLVYPNAVVVSILFTSEVFNELYKF